MELSNNFGMYRRNSDYDVETNTSSRISNSASRSAIISQRGDTPSVERKTFYRRSDTPLLEETSSERTEILQRNNNSFLEEETSPESPVIFRRGMSPPKSPPRRGMSPPKSPPRSPPRREASPVRRGMSPPKSPPRRGMSPPRRGMSPPRRGMSPPRRGMSPPRRGVSPSISEGKVNPVVIRRISPPREGISPVIAMTEVKREQKVTSFYRNFDKNFEILLEYKNKFSGSHSIDKTLAEKWITSQINSQRRKAARDLIDNTKYITFQEVFDAVGRVIKRIYEKIEQPVNLFVGIKTQSFHFMAVLAVHFIRQLGYKDPNIIYSFKERDLSPIRGKSLLMVDDMIYTGTQMQEVYQRLEKYNITVHLGLVAAAEAGIILLKKLPIIIYPDLIVRDLQFLLPKKDFVALSYYFGMGSSGRTKVSVYLDHKIGDASSTFSRTLMYGPILPSELKYDEENIGNLEFYLSFNAARYLNRQKEDIDTLPFTDEYEIYRAFFDEIMEEDKKTEREETELHFIPFINGCIKPVPKPEITKTMPYNTFITGKAEYSDEMSADYFMILYEMYEPKYRCIESFYKQKQYMMLEDSNEER